MVRIAYLGTDGCPGHHVIPIRGKFTEEDIKVIESIFDVYNKDEIKLIYAINISILKEMFII